MTTATISISSVTIRPASNGYLMSVLSQPTPAVGSMPTNTDMVFTSLSDLVAYLTRIGPIGRMLRVADERTRARVTEAVLPAFAPYVVGAEVRFVAACWAIGARAPRA